MNINSHHSHAFADSHRLSEHSDVISNIRIALIAAIGRNRELGNSKTNKLLWHIPEDFKHFKKLTLGHPIIMGRKTFESIGRPLPERLNIIITRNADYKAEGCLVVSSLEGAIKLARTTATPSSTFAEATADRLESGTEPPLHPSPPLRRAGLERRGLLEFPLLFEEGLGVVFVIGGGQIFQEAIKYADKLYLTLVNAEFPEADVFFPDYSEFSNIVSQKEMDNGKYKFSFLELTRPLTT